jgi:hypothetical protein
MKRAGRISLVLAAVVVVAILAVIALVTLTRTESPETVAHDFMNALVMGDADTLAKLSYMDPDTPEQIRSKWDFTVHKAGPHYRFVWEPRGSVEPDSENAAVRIGVYRNVLRERELADPYELPLVKVNGHWKVDVRAINREMYPGLPR